MAELVYLAYAHEFMESPVLVGVFSTKAKAYHAARAKVLEMIEDMRDVMRGTAFDSDSYGFGWDVVTKEVK